jgi:hypothetical protein
VDGHAAGGNNRNLSARRACGSATKKDDDTVKSVVISFMNFLLVQNIALDTNRITQYVVLEE